MGIIIKLLYIFYLQMPATIEDETVLDKIKQNCLDYGHGIGKQADLEFGDKGIIEEELNE